MKHRTHIENGGIKLAQKIVEANQNAKDDADLRNRFAAIHEYALSVLRDADKPERETCCRCGSYHDNPVKPDSPVNTCPYGR